MLYEDVADFPADQAQPIQVESWETHLYGARIVETDLWLKIDIQTLGQRLEPLDTLGTFKEGWRTSDQHVQSRESTRVNLIKKLPQRVEALVTDITADPLNRFHLIQ